MVNYHYRESMKGIFFLFISAILFSGCRTASMTNSLTKTPTGVEISLEKHEGKAQKLRIDVLSDKIIHVIASPVEKFSDAKSLMIDQKAVFHPVQFSVERKKDTVIISTKEIRVGISIKTGQLAFYDKNSGSILKEPAGGGKSFSPVSVEETNGYTLRQVFESPTDEAFYGLGQHQSEEFNHKGLNESLFQYNTKVSVPLIVSNKNYGILWDNYSLTKFGDPRDYSDINIFKLYDEKGQEGGLTATYLINSDTSRVFTKRKETAIDYENLDMVKNFPSKFPFGRSKIIWSGTIEPKESGLFFFKLYYAGYTKVYINNELVVPERWRTSWNPNTYKFHKELEKGHKYPIKIEWRPDGGVSYLGFKVLSPRDPAEQGNLSLLSEMGDQIDYYFIKGNNIDDVISGYRSLTGKATIMPEWAMGFWQSRERYKSQTELINVINEYRKRDIPLDNIVLDWSYWPVDAWGSHEFDPKFFPDPAGMVKQVHDLNAHIMISVWPKFYYTTEHYKEFDSKGWMYHQAIKDSIRDWIGKGYIGSFYDAYNPQARDLFWNQVREHLYTKGFDAWWMDASEPDILSNSSVEYRKKLTTPTALGPSTKYFNAYALVNAMAIYDGQRSVDNNKRVFLLTRSGYAGLQRYSTATWSGDIGTRWEDMKAQIPAGLNFALSGIPYWTFDIGGFCVENRYARAKEGSEDLEEWRELNTRWYQFGSFCPLFRSHGQFPYREIYNIAPENHTAYQSMVYYDRLRYRLMPYIYSLAGKTYFDDYTIMRAMVMDFAADKNVENIGDQYMFGPSLLVAPVYTYKARTREVYLPSGQGWYDIYSGKYFRGGQKINADAPYDRMPLFVREGSIVPVGPAIQYTQQVTDEPVTLYIYAGKNCEFVLYEDEGTNYNYEKGDYSKIKFVYDEAAGKLSIGKREGNFDGMKSSRNFRIVWISNNNAVPFDTDMKNAPVVSYNGNEISITR
jgi:alpha-D-xyloside xylohydrolase